MKKNEKLKIIFDASSLSIGVSKTATRGGIYFVTENILKELVNRDDIEVTLYCVPRLYRNLKITLGQVFSGVRFNFVNSFQFDIFSQAYAYWKLKKDAYKKQKSRFRKFFVQILYTLFSILSTLVSKILAFRKIDVLGYDAFLSPAYAFPDNIRDWNTVKKYTILHDVIPLVLPEYKKEFVKGLWFYELFQSLNPNDFYFSNSEYTKKDFLRYCPVLNENQITTTLLACNERFTPQSDDKIFAAKEKYGIGKDIKYIFSLCTLEPRKNLFRTVSAFTKFVEKNNINDLYFVLGGGQWDKFISKLESEVENFDKYKHLIIRAGYIDDEDLPALYSGAQWFVYTSQYEGFGLPLLEAMSCGVPVIASTSTSLPEVVGDVGISIQWDSIEQHIDAYEKYYFNESLKIENSMKGLERAKDFSWKKCTDIIINTIANGEE